MHAARAVVRDRDGLGEHAAGLAVVPLGIEQVDVHGEHHAGAELVADRLERAFVGAQRVVAVARIFERRETVAVDAGLADAEPEPVMTSRTASIAVGDLRARLEQVESPLR